MTKKIALIGGPGTGKSTTGADLFSAFKKIGHNTELVTEWIRRDLAVNGQMESVWEQYRTLMNHRDSEAHFPAEVEYVVVDSGCLTPFFYSVLYADKANPRTRLVIKDMFGHFIDDLYTGRYDYIFFFPRFRTDELGISLKDGIRYQTDDDLKTLEQFMTLTLCGLFKMNNIHVIDCPLEQRVEVMVRHVLGQDGVTKWHSAVARNNGSA